VHDAGGADDLETEDQIARGDVAGLQGVGEVDGLTVYASRVGGEGKNIELAYVWPHGAKARTCSPGR
jgi:hypothetical protein